jgi:hypothetical protein
MAFFQVSGRLGHPGLLLGALVCWAAALAESRYEPSRVWQPRNLALAGLAGTILLVFLNAPGACFIVPNGLTLAAALQAFSERRQQRRGRVLDGDTPSP